ncbi:bifunctional diaminohydroxyphosphoribosylaminopyrimidine deaminase/5-amino-6-(5-phosphoribosylamino)uracil reductase RibD [Dehalococcoidia bacterium]|nr:bifunctional diaminohydroxyphosphoribosylaminopyrimidine deaminase/5-amino-6-(5-phosphoribosylamino)uracil reductase RibD [Dehalococcoidia bacterium]
MQRALDLAESVLGTTSPNPAVGCVLVRDGIVVAEGATEPPGGLHAEKVALAAASDASKGSVMYVTLEPCCHQGRTPPCTTDIIAAGIAEVHLSTLDPNPKVNGNGKGILEAAGIRTTTGGCENEALTLNEAFLKWVMTGDPFVSAKFASSLDGKIATNTGVSKWITGDSARSYAHRLRAKSDAVLVGSKTVLMDDPQLTARESGHPNLRQPLRVVVDSKARISPNARILTEPGGTLVCVTEEASPQAIKALSSAGAEVISLPQVGAGVDLKALMRELGGREIVSVLAEGGGELLGSLFSERMVDKVYAFLAPVIMGGTQAPSSVGGPGINEMAEALTLRDVKVESLGEDLLIVGYSLH